MRKSPRPHLILIQRALAHIERYRPSDKTVFLTDPMVQDAVLMRLQIIGENLIQVRRLDSDAFQKQAPDSWHKLMGLRNIISHGYEAIEMEQIWQIITEELPGFSSTIDAAADAVE